MNIAKICIGIGGSLSLLMTLFHTRFYRLFQWKIAFNKMDPVNKKVLYTVHVALLLLFLLFSFISFIFMDELSNCEGLAFGIVLAYALFWLWRAIWQLLYFRPSKDRKPRRLYLHYILTVVFAMLFSAYFIPVVIKWMR